MVPIYTTNSHGVALQSSDPFGFATMQPIGKVSMINLATAMNRHEPGMCS